MKHMDSSSKNMLNLIKSKFTIKDSQNDPKRLESGDTNLQYDFHEELNDLKQEIKDIKDLIMM